MRLALRKRQDIHSITPHVYSKRKQVCELYINALSDITGCYFEDGVYELDVIAAVEFDKTFPPKKKVEDTASQKRFWELVASKRKRKT